MTLLLLSRLHPLARRLCAWVAGVGFLSALFACGDSRSARPTGPERIPVASVRITPLDDALVVGAEHTLQASPLSAAGAVLDDRAITWSSGNTAVATVSEVGVVAARAEGTAEISASSEGKTSRLEVRIVSPNTVPVITALEPRQITAGWAGPFTLTVNGTGLTPRSVVSWDGVPRATRFVDATSLQITIDPQDVRVARTVQVEVETPAPGGGRTSATFAVNAIPVARVTVQSPWGFAWTWRNHGLPLTAVAEDQLGRELTDRRAGWTVVNPSVASVVLVSDRESRVYGTAVGETEVEAVVDGVRAQRTVRVHDAPDYEIVYEAGEGDDRHLMLWDLTTANAPRRLPTPMVAFSPSPSPDGREVAFAGVARGAGPAGDVDLYIVARDGSTRRVVPNAAFDGDPSWSPDGSRLAFASARANGALDVHVVELASGAVTRLTAADPMANLPGSGAAARSPVWSPHGTQIAYTVQAMSGSQLWVMSPDGTNKRQLTSSADASDFDPAWAPDGSVIAFLREFRQPQRTVVMSVTPDGSALTNIGGRVVNVAASPAFSPDGRWLTTAQTRGSGAGAVYAFSVANNAGPRIVVPIALGGGRHARWMVRP